MTQKEAMAWFALVVGGYLAWTRGWFSPRTGMEYTEEELDGTTRLLLAETSFIRPKDEMIGIVQVAVNRAKKTGDLLSVVVPPGRPNWNNSDKYRARWINSVKYRQWAKCKDFVKKVLDGGFPNRIGDRTMFLHPHGMKRPNEENRECKDNRNSKYLVSTTAGRRCLPKWSTGSGVVVIDGARFSHPA